MSDTWQPVPRQAPFRCFKTGQDSPADGPYYEAGARYSTPGVLDDRELTLYLSAQALREIVAADGSPFVLRDRAEEAARLGRAAEVVRERDALRAEVERLLGEVESLRGRAEDVEALARRLEDHWSRRRPGPKRAA